MFAIFSEDSHTIQQISLRWRQNRCNCKFNIVIHILKGLLLLALGVLLQVYLQHKKKYAENHTNQTRQCAKKKTQERASRLSSSNKTN